MGSETGRPNEAPVHRVHVAPFRMGRTAVTNAQYGHCIEAGRVSSSPWRTDSAFTAADQPVVGVTWFEALAYTEWLSETLGLRFRLPTEAEWERAARGGLEGQATPWGEVVPSDEIPAGPIAGPWPVGRGVPNGYGLLDIGTIVHEWCLDWYVEDYYRSSPDHDPRGPDEGDRRVSRGGSWRHHVRWSTPSARSSLPPGFRYADYGFRVVEDLG